MGLSRYRAVLALPGARAPVLASVVGSMPIGMFGLAIILLGREQTGSFGAAGRVAGAFALANALGAVAQGRLMDRVGQTRVLRTAATLHPIAMVALVVAADRHAPVGVMALAAAGGGLALPQVPAAMRSLWGDLVADAEQRATAYALVSIMFEVAVITAPALVAGITAVASPAVAVLVAAALCTAGGFGFAATRGSRRWRGAPHAVGWLGPLAAPGMRTVVGVLAMFGIAFGVVQVAVPAFALDHGSRALSGVLLAALSAGTLTGGLVYGSRAWPGTLARRLTLLMALLGAAVALLAVAHTPAGLAPLLMLVGLCFGPTTVVCSTLLDTVAPAGTGTEAFTLMVMGVVAGTALGTAVGGALVDGTSYAAAVLIAGAVPLLGALAAFARRGTLAG